jgi:hypothetical protein
LDLDFELNQEFSDAFDNMTYATQTITELFHNLPHSKINESFEPNSAKRKEQITAKLDGLNYKSLDLEKLPDKTRFRLKGVRIPRWSYIVFKIDLKHEVDHSFIKIFNMHRSNVNLNNSVDPFGELQAFSGWYSPAKANDHRIWSGLTFVLCGLIFAIILGTLFVYKRKRRYFFALLKME